MNTRGQPRWRGELLAGVLFDLDGTLLDTLADIAGALNLALGEAGLAGLAEDEVRQLIGRGAPLLIERAVAARGGILSADRKAVLLQRFFHHYGVQEESGAFTARPYAGVVEALHELRAAGVRTAVVSNKHRRFATGLLQKLNLDRCFDVVVGGDTCERRKPDPQPLLFACDALGIVATQALMVGDSSNDVGAARAAAMPVVCVSYGYTEGRDPRTLACDVLIDTLAELPALLWTPPAATVPV